MDIIPLDKVPLDLLSIILGRYGWKNTKNIALTCKRFNEASCKPQYWEKAILDHLLMEINKTKITFVEPKITNEHIANMINPFYNLFCYSHCQNLKEYLAYLFIDKLFYFAKHPTMLKFDTIYILKLSNNELSNNITENMVIKYLLGTWHYIFGKYRNIKRIEYETYYCYFKNSDCYRRMVLTHTGNDCKQKTGSYNIITYLEYFDSGKNKLFCGRGKWQNIEDKRVRNIAVPDERFGVWI